MNWYVGTDWSVIPAGGNSLRQVFVRLEDYEALAADLAKEAKWRQLMQAGRPFRELKIQADRIRELESQDEVHWKTRRTLLAELAAVRADRQDLADRRGEFVERVYALEAALRNIDFELAGGHGSGNLAARIKVVRKIVASTWETPIAQSKSQQKRFEGVVPFAEETKGESNDG